MNSSRRLMLSMLCPACLLGCGGTGSGIIGQQDPEIRLFNGVDNEASITVGFTDVSGNALGTSQSTAYAGTSPSDLIIANTNATPTVQAGGTALFSGGSSLYRINSQYSLYVGGLPGNYVAIPLNDIAGQGNTVGSLDLRVVHVAARIGSVDVYIVPASPGGVSGTALFSSLTYGSVSGAQNASTTVDGNGYTLLAVTGNTLYEVIVTAHKGTTPIATTTAVLNPQIFYTAVVYDSGSGAGVKILSDRH
ncbi:MAG TPA: hypothetical protein VKT78_06500 [Fimbriimonadaceae bacterium]|nr:hypothetical protein [Fimbriimonadaceae bacterium]